MANVDRGEDIENYEEPIKDFRPQNEFHRDMQKCQTEKKESIDEKIDYFLNFVQGEDKPTAQYAVLENETLYSEDSIFQMRNVNEFGPLRHVPREQRIHGILTPFFYLGSKTCDA